jgi:hypothetical protein
MNTPNWAAMLMSEPADLFCSHFSSVRIDLDKPALLGLVAIDARAGQVFLNAIGVTSREYLLPDRRGAWTVLVENGSQKLTGKFAQHAIPPDSDVQTVSAIGGMVGSSGESTWRELEAISPTVPDLGNKIKLTPFERAILRDLSYVEEVCARPKAYLKFETTRLLVSQARRIPARAIAYLAAHTEDWERPTLRAVQPKRILSEVRQDEFDIYENRLTTRLVDRLLLVINPRISEVQKARRILSELLDYQSSTGGSHWRAERICSLWAETVSAAQSEKRARHTLDKLITIQRRLLALKDSTLYREIPKNADVSDSLKTTNILATDPIYKNVALLWLEWSRHVARGQKVPAEVFAEYRTFCESFKRYCLVLVVRALSQLGISANMPEEMHSVSSRTTIQLNKRNMTLEVLSSGAIQIREQGQPLIAFFPLPAAIDCARTEEELDTWLGDVCSAVCASKPSHSNVVLYLSAMAGAMKTLSSGANMRLQTIGNQPSLGKVRDFGFVPVSPWEIDCVERVARCLRWVITGRSLRLYPATVDADPPQELVARPCPRWFRMVGHSLLVVRHPRRDEWSASDIDGIHERAQEAVRAAEDVERKTIEAKERRRTAPHEQKVLAQNVRMAKRAIVEARSAYEVVDRFRSQIQRLLQDTEDVSECPVCKTPADPVLGFRWDQKFYEFTCGDCNAQWGVRTCHCGERVPFLLSGSAAAAIDRTPGWIDRNLGRDVLAAPRSDGKFECSACGSSV